MSSFYFILKIALLNCNHVPVYLTLRYIDRAGSRNSTLQKTGIECHLHWFRENKD
jgi:hypothetical protein